MKNLIKFLLKPLNPVDLEFGSRYPRNPYNFYERIRVIIIGYQTKDKYFFFLYSKLYKVSYIKIFSFNILSINFNSKDF